ncbi:hypothetical protein LHFGNBLO_000736 [Mesorhizobium sp. AR10]|uniref:hypothetical protein n=1 Tax=Mesorhizobium sp. AR10 TaxID=2865839 RepID=UPI0021603C33|nr:hypothetical protein [Mesorhizobium sp. AR10]UVK39376.1 hypothetical protein LHFGNBLO_000736 [Mesorhizobium sp. AR10]
MFGFGKKARRRKEAEGVLQLTMGGCSAIAMFTEGDAASSQWWASFAAAVGNIVNIAEEHLADCKTDADKERLSAELINLSDRAGDKTKEMAMGIVAMHILASTMRDEEAGDNAFYLAGAVIDDALQFIQDGRIPSAELAASMNLYLPG